MSPNEIFENKYRIIRELGKGGMGTVYLAENIKLGTLWAIKEICKYHNNKEDFLVEPNILKKLNHPALPRIFDIIEDNNFIYIIVDYIEGISLKDELARNGKFEEEKVIGWAKQICNVLEYIHTVRPNPIIYRDMKPSNIILTNQGMIKLIDFGIAREYKPESGDDTVYLGTRGYAAPEQFGIGQSNVTTDIYNLGITLHQLLTGYLPVEDCINIRNEGGNKTLISEGFTQIIYKCTRKDPNERYQSASEIASDLEKLDKSILVSGIGNINKNEQLNVRHSVSFKRLILTVWGNAELACELSYLIAKLTKFSVLLIDLDLMNPTVDLHLNIKINTDDLENEVNFMDSGLDRVLNNHDKNSITEKMLINESVMRRDLKNLFILTRKCCLENYNSFSEENLLQLLDIAYKSFDITILIANKSIFDLYTLNALKKSDFNLVPFRADIEVLREFERYTTFLNKKKNVQSEKIKYIAYEYDENANLKRGVLNDILGANLIGYIRFSRMRSFYRNLKIPYFRRIERPVLNDYIAIMSYFNIVPEITIFTRINDWIKVFMKYLRSKRKYFKGLMRNKSDGRISKRAESAETR